MSVSYTVTITDEENKALMHIISDPQAWIQHAISNKCRKCVNKVVIAESDFNVDKIDTDTKLAIVKNADIETRIEIDEKA